MDKKAALIVVMGASGCGKSSVGLALALQLGVLFLDGDDLHSLASIDKMKRGIPLQDEDRIPWLRRIRKVARSLTRGDGPAAAEDDEDEMDGRGEVGEALERVHPESLAGSRARTRDQRMVVVVACSALTPLYRDVLRGKGVDEDQLETFFLYLQGTRPLLLARMKARKGHFMKETMLDSQLVTLVPPSIDERGSATIKLGKGVDEGEEVGLEGVVQRSLEVVRIWGFQ